MTEPPGGLGIDRGATAMELVFVHGPAAAGKLTVARELGHLTGLPVFHNHLVVDVLLEVFEFGSPEFVALREQFWLATFRAAAASGRSLIFTFTPERTVRTGFPRRTVETVGAHQGRVRFVRLRVTDSEQERRIANQDRREFNKLADLDTLRRVKAEAASTPVDEPPADLIIDTETITPADAAAQIREAFGMTAEVMPRGYPPA